MTNNNILNKGFDHFKNILSKEETLELENIIDELNNRYSDKIDRCTNANVLLSIAGLNKKLDLLIEKILTNPKINQALEGTLGKNYKIWQINTRISSGKDMGLSMHEDSPGQANIWFFINTQNIPEGVTGVVPSSHLFPRICKKLSLSYIGVSKFLMKPMLGEMGDCSIFLNKVWHGRLPSKNNVNNKILAIGTFCEGSEYKPMPEAYDTSNINSNFIASKFGLKDNLKITNNNKYLIEKSEEKVPYALQIEKNKLNINILVKLSFYFFIEIFIRPIKLSFNFLLNLRKSHS
tara:strand:+ start:256 stop:1131 length:876 start_codon:yes stop_codon:yes gene_type:complete